MLKNKRRLTSETKLFVLATACFLLLAGTLPGLSHGIQRPVVDKEASWFVNMNRFAESAHSALRCKDCHGDMTEDGKEHPDKKSPAYLTKRATRKYDYSRCKECHPVAYERYQKGGHAKALKEEQEKEIVPVSANGDPEPGKEKEDDTRAPTCGDCHITHYEKSGMSRVEIGRRMTVICGDCHREHEASYLKDFHGRAAVMLGNEDSAYCSDCHGAHVAVSLKEKKDALKACVRCHADAGEKFAGYIVHASVDTQLQENQAKKKWARWIYRIKVIVVALVALTLVFFILHTFMWILRELHEKLKDR